MNSDYQEKINIEATQELQIHQNIVKTINEYSLISNEDIIEIDGSILEGGGQIIRISLALGVILKKSLKIYKIRAGRSNPGLQRQHIASATALAEITESKLDKLRLSSKELLFKPNDLTIVKPNYKCDCNGAGSIGLVIQQILPILLFSSTKTNLELIGGTIVSHAPPVYYINDILKPILKRYMNIEITLDVKRQGIFPRGGGIVNLSVEPVKYINPVNISSRGKLQGVFIRGTYTENFSKYISVEATFKEIFKQTKKLLSNFCKLENYKLNSKYYEIEDIISLEKEYVPLNFVKKENSYTLFSQIILYFENTVISVEQLYSDKVEKQEVKNFSQDITFKLENILKNQNECLDEFTVDHLIIFMALAKGKSKINVGKISTHTLTAIEIIKNFLPSIEINILCTESENVIEIEGISWNNENFI